ncbi:MAG: hypothetical protein JXB26_13935 [Candidatus Aminicenantes bacterium]|nr:hypothetical protein [Candidatus Aminicenantes bacterium]
MKTLSKPDEILLLTILRLDNDASSIDIVRDIEDRTGKIITFGALWVSMDILTKKGLAAKRMDEPGESGGRKKIFYTVTSEGIAALEASRKLHTKLWQGIDHIIDAPKDVS